MKALPWIAMGLMTLGASFTVVGYVLRQRDREIVMTKFAQYLPGN